MFIFCFSKKICYNNYIIISWKKIEILFLW
jgi:hypothetical protein